MNGEEVSRILEKLDELEDTQTLKFNSLNGKIEKLEYILKGNGQRGLMAEVEVIKAEQRHDRDGITMLHSDHKRMMWWLLGISVGIVVTVLGFLIERAMDK